MQSFDVRIRRPLTLLLLVAAMMVFASGVALAQEMVYGVNVYSMEYDAVGDTGVTFYDIDQDRVVPTDIPGPGIAQESGDYLLTSRPYKQQTGSPMKDLWLFPKLTGKLWRGLNNTLFGWVEVPKHIIKGVVKTDPFTGTIVGFVKGVGYGVVRTGVGVFEMVTFWGPWPRHYSPVMMPEYVVEDLVH
ncbi:MAG: exosortase system-associated protein, TIGR04073 family [Candidatus Sumerlaeia bacterium]